MTDPRILSLNTGFDHVYGVNAERFVFAPGRFNLIGEHVDYLGGKVLPGAITQGISVAVGPRDDGQIHLYSTSFPNESKSITIDGITSFQPELGWANYPIGMLFTLRKHSVPLLYPHGCNLYFKSDLPRGAGLSSSAAIELATAYALSEPKDDDQTRSRYALLAQEAENSFVGVQCGIMDQFAIAQGRPEKLVLLDTSSLEFSPTPWPLSGTEYGLYILNSNKERQLAESAFNERRAECDRALQTINTARQNSNLPQISQLAEITSLDLKSLSGNELKRARHVFNEVRRVRDTVATLADKTLSPDELARNLGAQLKECHTSLSQDFEVSCLELDTLVDLVGQSVLCLGARMVGAGFGGCVLALLKTSDPTAFTEFQKKLAADYTAETELPLTIHPIFIGPGVYVMK